MIRIGICDDDPLIAMVCEKRIREILHDRNIQLSFKSFASGESFVFYIEDKVDEFDIIFMDVIMDKLNGLETMKIVRRYGYKGVLIFLTSSKGYALDAFEVTPIGYVLKDELCKDKFKNTLNYAIELVQKVEAEKVRINIGKTTLLISTDEVIYIESENKKIRIHTINDIHEFYATMDSMNDFFAKYNMFRCHKSFIVNPKYVIRYTSTEVMLNNGATLPIGRKYSNEFSERFTEYLAEEVLS